MCQLMSGRGTSVEDPFRTQVATAIGFLGGMDRRNLRMLPNVLSILASVHETTDDGLFRATPDFAGMPSDARQSFWGPPPIAAAVS